MLNDSELFYAFTHVEIGQIKIKASNYKGLY